MLQGRKTFAIVRAALLFGTACTVAPASAAWARDVADAAAADVAADADSGGIVVTGTRSGTTPYESTSPISVVSNDSLQATGQPDLRTGLAAIAPSFIAAQGSNGSSSSKPVRSAALRGLSGFHTLVLVDGKRRHNTALLNNTGGTAGAPADLSFLPISAIGQVEVLSDGASAQYGSDAVAGVVNLRLNKDPRSGSAYAQAGFYDSGLAHVGGLGNRGVTYNFGASQAVPIGQDGGFLRLSGEYRHVDDSNVVGPIRTASATDPTSRIFAVIGDARETTESRHRQLTEVQPFGFAWSLVANGEVPVGDRVKVYGNATFGRNSLSSTGTYRSENNVATILGAVPSGGYVPTLTTRQRDYQYTVGLNAEDLGGWDLDLSFSDAGNRGRMYVNGINASFGGSRPYHDFYVGELKIGQQVANLDLQRSLDTGWGSGPLEIALGAEYRRDSFTQSPGEPDSYENGGFIYPSDYPSTFLRGKAAAIGSPFMTGFRPEWSGKWSRHSYAAYADLAQELADGFKVALAGRFEHFSDFGSRVSGKLSARYEVAPGLALRATVNNGFRAPSLAEQFTTVVNQGPSIVNGISQQINTYNSIRYNAPAAQALGAKALRPETSLNFSAGIVARPTDNLNLSIDAYQISIDDRIALTGQFNPAAAGATGAAVRALLVAAGLDPTLRVQYFANIGDTRTRGVEFKADLHTDVGSLGVIDWTLAAAYNHQKVTGTEPALPSLAAAGLVLLQRSGRVAIENGSPKLIARAIADWKSGAFGLRLTGTYFSKTYSVNANFPDDERYNSVQRGAVIADIAASYDVVEQVKLTLGANNLFNRGADQIPTIAAPLQTVGATYPLPVGSPFGQGGRFLYARLGVTW